MQMVTIATLTGLAATIFRVKRVALNKTTPIFFAYLIFELVRSTTLFAFPTGSLVYFWTYVGTAAPLWALYVLTVRELFGLFFAGYPGIRTASRYMLYAAMAISVLVSALSLAASWRVPSGGRRDLLFDTFFVERGIVFALAVFLMIMLAYLPQYRVLLTRNVVVHSAVFGTLFLADALILLVEYLMPGHFRTELNAAVGVVSLCCYWAWALLLRREGTLRMPTGNPDAEVETPLLRQLTALNNALIRSSGGKPKQMPRDAEEFSSENSPADLAPLDYGADKTDVRPKRGRLR